MEYYLKPAWISSVATEELSSVATEEISSVAADLFCRRLCGTWFYQFQALLEACAVHGFISFRRFSTLVQNMVLSVSGVRLELIKPCTANPGRTDKTMYRKPFERPNEPLLGPPS